jgi:hypothetical protein
MTPAATAGYVQAGRRKPSSGAGVENKTGGRGKGSGWRKTDF